MLKFSPFVRSEDRPREQEQPVARGDREEPGHRRESGGECAPSCFTHVQGYTRPIAPPGHSALALSFVGYRKYKASTLAIDQSLYDTHHQYHQDYMFCNGLPESLQSGFRAQCSAEAASEGVTNDEVS